MKKLKKKKKLFVLSKPKLQKIKGGIFIIEDIGVI